MGMCCDQIKGYQMKVLDEYLELWKTSSHDDTVWERYISDEAYEKLPQELKDLGFRPYYTYPEYPDKDNIMLLYDGVMGKYAWLIYIVDIDYESDNESDPNETVNEMLKQIPVPSDIEEKMRKCYEIIFGKECKNQIFFQEMSHWH